MNEQVTALAQLTASLFGVQLWEMIDGPRGSRTHELARHALRYVIRRRLNHMGLTEIGKAVGGRDHSSVSSSLRATKKLLESNEFPFFSRAVTRLLTAEIPDLPALELTDVEKKACTPCRSLPSSGA